MKLEEIIKGIEDGKITVNLQGHKIYTPVTDNYWGEWEDFNLLTILKRYTVNKENEETSVKIVNNLNERLSAGEIDNKKYTDLMEYAKTFDAYDSKLSDYTMRLRKDVEIGQCIFANYDMSVPFFQCEICGRLVFPYLKSETEIVFCNRKGISDSRCEGEYLNGVDHLEAVIDVTEHLGFSNHFREERLNLPFKKFYNINFLQGRDEQMQECAQAGIGYGQCDDCSCNVYMSKDKNKVIVAKNRTVALDKKYEYQGHICFDVWSYRCVDTAKIKSMVDNYDELLDKNPNEIGSDYFEVRCNPGKYKITHYDNGPRRNIWSKIEKIG